MRKLLIAIPVSLAVGFATAALIENSASRQEHRVSTAATDPEISFDQAASVLQRIMALERAVSDERMARQLLQEELLFLTDELERLAPPALTIDDAEPTEVTDAVARETRRAERRRRNTPEGRAERLVEAGMQPGQAAWIVQRESELQMQALRARYDAERDGTPYSYSESRNASQNTLRAELGDTNYEQYLEASGRSTNVSISNVIESSPAQRAGLQIGDEIVRYDGVRVFGMSDLTTQTMQGDPNVNVTVDIVRDGIPMQIVLPRGPVGISAGRRYSR